MRNPGCPHDNRPYFVCASCLEAVNASLKQTNGELTEHLRSLIASSDNKQLEEWEIEVARKALKRVEGGR